MQRSIIARIADECLLPVETCFLPPRVREVQEAIARREEFDQDGVRGGVVACWFGRKEDSRESAAVIQ